MSALRNGHSNVAKFKAARVIALNVERTGLALVGVHGAARDAFKNFSDVLYIECRGESFPALVSRRRAGFAASKRYAS